VLYEVRANIIDFLEELYFVCSLHIYASANIRWQKGINVFWSCVCMCRPYVNTTDLYYFSSKYCIAYSNHIFIM